MTDPAIPRPAALSVVVRRDRVLLVRRHNPPDAGLWGFPGGRIEWGERLEQAAVRELREETGVVATAGEVLTALNVIDGSSQAIHHHFVLIAVRCHWQTGDGIADDDASEIGWFTPDEIAAADHQTSADVEWLARLALAPDGR
ncbi:ADP-ribose pyrophosphatase YjhB (NUDIX family) [Kushneria sinocarnis]|uniref:ADP-ribose pyrophosphatase YjhB (NUDIX family) n=1 Tax=Kushneria sinocarnis TaxID=595502 RepID=A0A420WWM9_9GAMM|nr:NUDIX hydrolase [Kushneria sinocarnis]RKR03526.1 ADP-ribose pyrophosphatase YjhB (NUDIX family) [Kushneria sinocarnis]